MGKIAFVFAGQGAQYTGMGEEIKRESPAAQRVFAIADAVRPETARQCFLAPKEELSITVNTQPCLFTVDLAIAMALFEQGIVPEGAAGFSLGEIPALTFAGAFGQGETGIEAGFRLVILRGQAMNRAAGQYNGGMAAVLRLNPMQVEELAFAQGGVFPVNYNSPAQTVVAGEKSSLMEFEKRVREAKGMMVPLAVSGAFHSPQMEEAAQELAEALRTVPYRKTKIPVYANIDGRPYPAEEQEAKARIAAQVKSPVQWQKTIEKMIEDGFDTFIEVGPGKTLSGLIKKIWAEAAIYNVEKAADLYSVTDELKQNL